MKLFLQYLLPIFGLWLFGLGVSLPVRVVLGQDVRVTEINVMCAAALCFLGAVGIGVGLEQGEHDEEEEEDAE